MSFHHSAPGIFTPLEGTDIASNSTRIGLTQVFAEGVNLPGLTTGALATSSEFSHSVTFADSGISVGDEVWVRLGDAGNTDFDEPFIDELTVSSIDSEAPVLTVTPATGVGTTTATLRGEVSDIGSDAPSITFFYGDEDGGQNAAAWDASVSLAGTHNGVFSHNVTGLTPAKTYFVAAQGSNSSGDAWSLETENFTTQPLAPAVETVAASDILASSATVGATVTATGGEDPTVRIYYGTSDSGTNAEAWTSSATLGVTSNGGTTSLSGLANGTVYYFRACASNSGGNSWAPSGASFTTAIATPPAVVNRTAVDITGSTARLRGTVTTTGSDPPLLTFYFGTSDGGTSEGAWERSASAGTDSGNFSKSVSLLIPETNYFFRIKAANSAGPSWSPTTESFATTAASALGVVINEVHHDAEPKTERAEFIELFNAGDVTVDLSNWHLKGVQDFIFPGGTSLAPGQYLVVAEDSATMLSKFGVTTPHQYLGGLNNDGDDLRLLDGTGAEIDRVNYQSGFPWPTAARGTGASMELIHPALDNDLGGSWRSSGTGAVGPPVTYLPAGSTWRYRKGTSEASTPIDDWRKLNFAEDVSWLSGPAVIGYGDGDDATVLADMQNGYSSVYLRKTFDISADNIPSALLVRVYVDDGAIVWINGIEVGRPSVSAGEKAYNDFAINHDPAWEEIVVNNASNILVGGTNIIAVHALNTQLNSSDFSIDVELKAPDPGAASGQPTPAAANSVASVTATGAAPAIRQVAHQPVIPADGQSVSITAKVTVPDGVGPVTLSYQLVDPGSYIRKSDAGYDTTWTTLAMVDDGSGGDALPADGIYTATMPAATQVHRRLVRYRITVEDTLGNSVRVPYADDESPNFAYFVYNGVPAWDAASQPGSTGLENFPATVMANSQPTYHLIANSSDVTNSQYNGGFNGTRMWGTMVYEGIVYDHIKYYNRGEVSTYVSGKNKWRFKFNRARDFEARNIYGQRYASMWKTMNFNSCASPWVAANRGIAGLDEAVPHRLHRLAGVPGSMTHWVHFRVVDAADEAPTDQYGGDLWGQYLAIQHLDRRFLEEHGLPDGNIYKIEGGSGDKKNQSPTQTEGSSDWSTFYGASGNLNTVSWWRSNFDLDSFYGFRAINRATSNVDLRDGSNYYMYHHPDDRWRVMPWDLDMMFAPVTHQSGTIRADRCLDHPEINIEFKNRCRELLDLLFSDIGRHGGHAAQVVEELSRIVNPTGVPLTLVDADEFMWSYHPRTSGSHRGPWYELTKFETRLSTDYLRTIPTADHEGFQQSIIDFMFDTRTGGGFAVNDTIEDGYGFGYLSLEAADIAIPDQPTISYNGTTGFPADGAAFQSASFNDPQGAGTFGAMEWRIGEIRNPSTSSHVAGEPWVYEVTSIWESGETTTFDSAIVIPTTVLRTGHTYRARVRHADNTGRWSHWSDPLEFVATEPAVAVFQQNLVITEIMYNPPGGSDYEFIELKNVGATSLDLTDVRFTKGIDYDFPDQTMINPGEHLLVVRDQAAFESRYGTGLPIAGEWTPGDKLSNGGERLKLSLGAGTAIHDLDYLDVAPWPVSPDGSGYSLVLRYPDFLPVPDHALPSSWRASASVYGSPGADDFLSYSEWANETFTAAELLDPAISGTDADPEHDGLPNFLEFFFHSNPKAPDGSPTTLDITSGTPTLTFLRRNSASDSIDFEVQASSDLLSWQSASTDWTMATIDNGDGSETVILTRTDPVAAGETLFVRLQLSSL